MLRKYFLYNHCNKIFPFHSSFILYISCFCKLHSVIKRINSYMKTPTADPRGGWPGEEQEEGHVNQVLKINLQASICLYPGSTIEFMFQVPCLTQQYHTGNCVVRACLYACLPHIMWSVCMRVQLKLCGACVFVCVLTSHCGVRVCVCACLPHIVWCVCVCMRVYLTLLHS